MTAEPQWRCEEHPEREWPHDDCVAPGALVFPPHAHEFDGRGFCVMCRLTLAEADCEHGYLAAGGSATCPACDV